MGTPDHGLSPILLAWVLVAAACHAGWNFLVKSSPDKLVDTVGLAVVASALAALSLPFVGLPAGASWPWLLASVAIHVVYFLAVVEAYRWGDLSATYPVMRGAAPVLVMVGTTLQGDIPAPGVGLGVALISLGITAPAWVAWRQGRLVARALGVALANACVIALYTLVDGTGARLSGNALAYTQWLFFLDAFGIFFVAVWRRGLPAALSWRQRLGRAGAGAVFTLASYGIVLWAMTRAPIPLVAALRETSVIFAALLGCWGLKESFGPWRLLGAGMVVLGILCLRGAL